jgi:hypothetical protein
VNVTWVEPIGNSLGPLLVTVGLASQASAADAIPDRLTGALSSEAVGITATKVNFENVRTGGVVSRTVTLVLELDVKPALSVAVNE